MPAAKKRCLVQWGSAGSFVNRVRVAPGTLRVTLHPNGPTGTLRLKPYPIFLSWTQPTSHTQFLGVHFRDGVCFLNLFQNKPNITLITLILETPLKNGNRLRHKVRNCILKVGVRNMFFGTTCFLFSCTCCLRGWCA